ncbi:mitochondrial glycoprotein family protein [Striga asiatica]|uniref:Mitochondrial glycoprotein family protein n=1 Tax=Striga asiatica TaxID=4170 RepID=A0A5A7R1Y3_STRAF|nr:mitochondrial glycoprotein family protein [Striga asiatica]
MLAPVTTRTKTIANGPTRTSKPLTIVTQQTHQTVEQQKGTRIDAKTARTCTILKLVTLTETKGTSGVPVLGENEDSSAEIFAMSGGALISGRRRACPLIKSICSTILRRGAHKSPDNALLPHSPLQSKMQRLLSNEIQYQCDYAPPHQPLTEYDGFSVEDRPGEQLITLSGKSTEDENIKIDATMFDGFIVDRIKDERGTREKPRFHISMLVDIRKGERSDAIKFVCSAWPDSLEIQKVFVYKHDESSPRFYMGPDFKAVIQHEVHVFSQNAVSILNLYTNLQIGFYQFLDVRGVNDKLALFLHKYIANKDRIELIQWMKGLFFTMKHIKQSLRKILWMHMVPVAAAKRLDLFFVVRQKRIWI